MELNRARYKSQECFELGLQAWQYLERAIKEQETENNVKASISLSLACHKELLSLGFESTLHIMRHNVRASWC